MVDELIEAGVTPETLMKAQGIDPAPLALLKANVNLAQPALACGQQAGQNGVVDPDPQGSHAGSLHVEAHRLI